MRVFVAGAVGRRLVPLLVSAGHSVVGMTRTPAKADAILAAGGEAAVADALNRAATVEAVAIAKPDAIVHEMTSLSAANDLRRFDETFADTNRLRTEGLSNLLAAAKQAGTPRIVVQSFCGWPYASIGGPVKSEDDPLDPEPPRQFIPRGAKASQKYCRKQMIADSREPIEWHAAPPFSSHSYR